MSNLRCGIWAVCLACLPVAAADLSAVTHQSWQGAVRVDTLLDGSVMTEYLGHTPDERELGADLRVGFIPRFGCEPVVTAEVQLGPLKVSARQAEKDTVSKATRTVTVTRAVDHFDDVDFAIDRTPADFPLLVDEDGPVATLVYHGSRSERIRLRLQIDMGARATIVTASGEAFDFSLLGSRLTLEAAEDACRSHVPLAE